MTTTYNFNNELFLFTVILNKNSNIKDQQEYKEETKMKTIIDDMTNLNKTINKSEFEPFDCTFITQFRKTGKIYELIINSHDLKKINNIFLIDSGILYNIVNEEPCGMELNNEDTKDECVIIDYTKSVLDREIRIGFKIPVKKYKDRFDKELITSLIKEFSRELIDLKHRVQILESNDKIIIDKKMFIISFLKLFINKYKICDLLKSILFMWVVVVLPLYLLHKT